MDDGSDLMRMQGEIAPDVALLEEYGRSVPEVWTGVRFDGPTLVALLTEPADHRDALLALVRHPDRLEVRRSPYSRRHLDQVHEQALAMIGPTSGRWTSHGPGLERVTISLRSPEAELAEALHERFGDALELHLGGHAYPLDTTPRAPGPAPRSTTNDADLELTAALDQDDYRAGDTMGGRLRVRNRSATRPFHLSTGSPVTGVLVDTDGRLVGRHTGFIAGTGYDVDLAPGADATIRLLAGSDTVDPSRGAVLPPGDYLLVVPLAVVIDGRQETLVSEPAPVRLV